ncbi:MAG: hypothetical protein GX947_00620 [Tissierellia bacterium]|nr:hypothetical protein [Tissierellia bacterium]
MVGVYCCNNYNGYNHTIPYKYAFKVNSGYDLLIAEWDSGDALTFYGTVLGSIVTVIGLITTIIFTNKQNRQSEIFQRNMIIADNKKVLLEEKYENILNWIYNIKEVVLLEVLEGEGFLDKIFNNSLNNFLEKVLECYKYLNSQVDVKEGIDKEFYDESKDRLMGILYKFKDLSCRIEKAENDMEEYQERKEQYRSSPDYINDKINHAMKQPSNRKFDENKFFNEGKGEPKSIKNIYKEFRDELKQDKGKYNDNYTLLFNKCIEYKKDEKLKIIESLYDFSK